MKIEAPENSNYAAVVCRLPQLHELAGCDNLIGAPLLGFQAIVSKDHAAGELGIVFPAECQISHDFCAVNGLYRHSTLNKDPEAKGYLEDNRRVRAIRLRGHRSDCLFMPIDSLAYTGVDLSTLTEGMEFDRLGDHEICKKYVIRTKASGRQQPKQEKKFIRVNPALFPEHADTDNWYKLNHLIPPDQWVYVTAKLHGTSWRGTRTKVLRPLTLRDRVARRLGVKVQEHEWDAVAGSRKVIKDVHHPSQNHFYSSDIWSEYLARIEHAIPEGFVVYGEIIGWTPGGAPIQTNYTYSLPPQTNELFVYRVAVVNERGLMVDLSWPQVRQFCGERGLRHVPDLWEGFHRDFVPEDWVDKRFVDEGHVNALPLGPDKKLVDEGVCVRSDGLMPTILKAKSSIFLQHESKLLDKGVENLEDQGSADDEGVA